MEKPLEEYSKEELVEMVTSLKRRKKFGLVWEDKPEKVAIDCDKKLPVLKEMPEKALCVGSDDDPTHILIEGDNYHALSTLNYTHKGKIDVIYIDPPYNTGNKDFIYNDRFVDKDDLFKHSKWLSFMSRRLKIAKSLLKPTGLIFISIDNNEKAYLKILCDEIFNEKNFLNEFVWVNNLAGRQISNHGAAGTYESVLCYARNIDCSSLFTNSLEFLKTLMPNTYKGFNFNIKKDQEGYYITTHELYNGNSAFNEETRPSLVFNIYYRASDGDIQFEKPIDQDYILISPHKNNDGVHLYHAYRWSKKKIIEKKNDLEFIKDGDSFKIYTKRRDFNLITLKDIITDIVTVMGRNDLNKIRPIKKLNYPKPVKLIQVLLKSLPQHDFITLDFFAGSGTTAQAVLELNKEDGGKRQCILCTNNENNIAEDVTYPRVKTVITGIRPDGSKYSDGIPANFRYFKTDFVEKGKTTDATRENLVTRATDILRIKEGTFTEEIDTATFKAYSNHQKLTVIVFDPFKMTDIWKEVESLCIKKHNIKVCLYIFSYSPDVSAFTDDIPKTTSIHWESKPIPDGILATYKQIFKEKETK